ncbi:MAG: TolB family protein [Candidatus Limnocylindria bacterium]
MSHCRRTARTWDGLLDPRRSEATLRDPHLDACAECGAIASWMREFDGSLARVGRGLVSEPLGSDPLLLPGRRPWRWSPALALPVAGAVLTVLVAAVLTLGGLRLAPVGFGPEAPRPGGEGLGLGGGASPELAWQAVVPAALPQSSTALEPFDEAGRLLDIGGGGALSASVSRPGLDSGPLQLRADGSAVEIELPGPDGPATLAAAFAPDGTTLMATDGNGALWRIDVMGTEPTRLARSVDVDGEELRFGSGLRYGRDGTLVGTAVDEPVSPSVSMVVVIDPADGSALAVSPSTDAYGPVPLADGSVAYRTDADDATVIHRVAETDAVLATIEDAGSVDVSPDASRIAFDRGDDGVFVMTVADGAVARVADGLRPRFSPDGRRLSVLDGGGTLEIDLSGTPVVEIPSVHTAWVSCSVAQVLCGADPDAPAAPQFSAFGPGQALHCSRIEELQPSEAEVELKARGHLRLSWRLEITTAPARGVSEVHVLPPDGVITDASLGPSGEMIVFVAPYGDPNASNRPSTAGC